VCKISGEIKKKQLSEYRLRTYRSTDFASYCDYVKGISDRRTLNKCEETDRHCLQNICFNLRYRRTLNTVKPGFHQNNNWYFVFHLAVTHYITIKIMSPVFREVSTWMHSVGLDRCFKYRKWQNIWQPILLWSSRCVILYWHKNRVKHNT